MFIDFCESWLCSSIFYLMSQVAFSSKAFERRRVTFLILQRFNEKDVVVGFSEPLIHAFCKNSVAINHKGSLYHQIRLRKNVLLLGDGVGGTVYLFFKSLL